MSTPGSKRTNASPANGPGSGGKRRKIGPGLESDAEHARRAIAAGLSVFIDQKQLAVQRDLEEQRQDLEASQMLLEEAKRAAPALFAVPGDLFYWQDGSSWHGGPCVMEYLGRNKSPPRPVEFMGGTDEYKSPDIGWLLFKDSQHSYEDSINRCSGGVRDAVGAWPIAKYQHYDDEGRAVDGTLCIPPEKCGALNVFNERDHYEDYEI